VTVAAVLLAVVFVGCARHAQTQEKHFRFLSNTKWSTWIFEVLFGTMGQHRCSADLVQPVCIAVLAK
jgi:hypothetical protein